MDVPTQPAEGSQKQPEIGVHPTFLIYYPSVKSQISAHHAWPGGTKPKFHDDSERILLIPGGIT